jgi:hypothetical protein
LFWSWIPLKKNPPCPFKINSSWFEDPSFKSTLTYFWSPYNSLDLESPQLQFLANINKVKKESYEWGKEKRSQDNSLLIEIEKKKRNWMELEGQINIIEKYKEEYKAMEKTRKKILLDQEK